MILENINQKVLSTKAMIELMQLQAQGASEETAKEILLNRQYTQSVIEQAAAMKASTLAKQMSVDATKEMNINDIISLARLKGLTTERAKELAMNLTAKASKVQLTAASLAEAGATKEETVALLGLSMQQGLTTITTQALTAALTIGLSLAFMGVTTLITKHIQAQKDAKEAAYATAQAYSDERKSLDETVQKYKDLHAKLQDHSLSENEILDIKSQLVGINQDLYESYGKEAEGIDLVNGKYEYQLDLLEKISKENALNTLESLEAEYQNAKEALSDEKSYDLFSYEVNNTTSLDPNSRTAKIQNFVEQNRDKLQFEDILKDGSFFEISITANPEEAEKTLDELYKDLREYGEQEDIDVSDYLAEISKAKNSIWTDELKKAKETYDQYITASIMEDDDGRKAYKDLTDAVSQYNDALSSGEGVEQAKANLEKVRASTDEVSNSIEGSGDVFDSIYDKVNTVAEAEYNMNQALDTDKVKDFLKLKFLNSDGKPLFDLADIMNVNFDDGTFQKGEWHLNYLMQLTGIGKDNIQMLIDKLVELGYVSGQVSEDNPVKAWTKGDMIDHLTTLGDGFKAIQDVFEDVENGKGFDWTKLDSSKFTKAFEGMDNEVAEFRETIAGSPNDINKCREAFNKLVTSYIQNKVALGEINEGNAKVTADYLKMYGITNAEAIVEHELADTRLDLALSNQSLEEGYENLIDESGNLVDACSKETNGFIDVKYEAGEMTKALASAMLKKMAFADNPINVTDDINNLVRLAKTAGFTGDSLMRIEEIKAKYNKGLQYQDTKLMQEAATEWNNFYSTFEDNLADYIYEPVDYTSPKDGSKGSSKDTWLEEYKDKLKILQDQLAMQEITEKEYYDGAEQLMFHYLMSSEERLKKYEKEIADAQKDLHDSWIKAYEEGKTELDNQLSKGLITQIQYLKQLATLGDQYFGILGTGGIKPVTELPDELQEWVARYEEINQQCLEYSANLDDIYKKYGNINNMDRQIIYWDDATLEKWAKQIEDWNWNWDGQLKDTWTTVLGDSQNFNGLEIAFSAILNTDKGAVPLTKDEFDKYINQVINTASKNGGYNAENVLKFDAQGFDMMVNGSMQHVSNMIAAVEGQIVNGAKLTANDVLAISGVTSKEMGYNLNSAFEGKSMHVIQEKVLEAKKEYEQLAKEAKNAGYNIEEYIGEYGSEAVQKYGYYVKEVAEKTKELAEGLKDAMDKSIQAIMSLIDTQISKLEKAEKKQKRPLEQAKKELEKQSREYNKLIKGLDKQIKVIDKEIDKLDEANEKRSQELKLMKAKYELQRAENQKNQLVKNMPEYTVMYIEKVTISVKG